MPASLNENPQYMDIDSELIVNGYIYIGDQGADPVLNPKDIFSDRDLSVALANPQRTGADGRSVNKIFTGGRYSIKVEDEDNAQKLEDLDAGEAATEGVNELLNVAGTDAITATGSTTISSYVDKQQFLFKAAGINTTAVSLNIDSVGAKAIERNFDQALVAGQIQENQVVVVTYNASTDTFELMNENRKTIRLNKGADIVSAATLVLGDDGNYFNVTGATGPITAFSGRAGTPFTIEFAAAPTLTHAAGLQLPGDIDFIAKAGDVLQGWMLTDSTAIITGANTYANGRQTEYFEADGMIIPTTNGAAPGLVETSTNKVMISTLDFDPTTEEFAQIKVKMNKGWDLGALRVRPEWSHPVTTVNFGVTWGIEMLALGNDDAIDAAWGTEVTIDDTGGTTDDLYEAPESGDITPAGSPAELDTIMIRITRVVGDANDTLAVDARLHGLHFYHGSKSSVDN